MTVVASFATSAAWRVVQAAGLLADVDVLFARTLGRLGRESDDEVLLAAALASAHTRDGHVCLDLPRFLTRPLLGEGGEVLDGKALPTADAWLARLRQSRLVTDLRKPSSAGGVTPLVLRGSRLYLRRYFAYEERLAAALRARATTRAADTGVQEKERAQRLQRLFPDGGDQRTAAEVAAGRHLAVITGGPGTGKTSTVARLLALLQEEALAAGGRPLAVRLLAPTGKAAARVVESIAAARDGLPVPAEVREALPTTAGTLHQALGATPGRAGRFRFGPHNPIPADVVIVDEASMVGLSLMTHLLEAVPEHARLILLGDRHQLASVDAGAILADVCEGARVAPLSEAVVHLTRSYRFREGGGIGALAAALHAGDSEGALALLRAGGGEVELRPLPADGSLGSDLTAAVVEGFRPVLHGPSPKAALAALGRFRVLCAHRRGRHGALATNDLIARALARHQLLTPRGIHYAGRPVLVTANDYGVRLFNGDVGLLLELQAAPPLQPEHGLRVFFPNTTGASSGGEPRMLAPSRLPPHETAFAMTIHKSQGSEFDEVAVLLPQALSPILTRELLYTAVTRARRRVVLYGDATVVAAAVARRVDRASGLEEALASAT